MQNIHLEFTSSFVFGLPYHLQLKEMTANYFIGKYIYIWGRLNISHSGHPEMNAPHSVGCVVSDVTIYLKGFAFCFKSALFSALT